MKVIDQCQRQADEPTNRLWFPAFVSSLLILFVGCSVAIILSARRDQPVLFAGLPTLLGENASPALLIEWLICQDDGHSTRVQASCTREAFDPLASKFSLRVSDGITDEISFTLRDHAFTLGDLVLRWGQPDIRYYCETAVAAWPAFHVISIVRPSSTGTLNYFSSVIAVYFTRAGLPRSLRSLSNDILHDCGGARHRSD